MAITSLGMQGSHLSDLSHWATSQVGHEARRNRVQRQQVVKERLSELLFGLELNLEEMAQYRARLVQALVCVDDIASDSSLPPITPAKVPRDQVILRTGGVNWRPFQITEKLVDISPTQRLLEHSLAKAVQAQISLNPMSVPRCYHTVGIVVAQGSEGVRYGEDRVELSSWGFEIMDAKDYPEVARLRLPPRFPSQAEIVKFRAS